MIELKNISMTYPNGAIGLSNINISICSGEFVVLVGLSGAGKSTLLRSINGLVAPDVGSVYVSGVDIVTLKRKELRQLRRKMGMIFQNFNLIHRSNVLKNVLIGRLGYTSTIKSVFNMYSKSDISLAYESLHRVNMEKEIYKRADELSGGQQQRVSIARALTQQPNYILADEPIASLDPPTSHQVLAYLKKVNQEDKITTIVNLHSIDMAMEYADRIIGMRDGRVVFDGSVDEVTKETFEGIYGRRLRDDLCAGVGKV